MSTTQKSQQCSHFKMRPPGNQILYSVELAFSAHPLGIMMRCRRVDFWQDIVIVGGITAGSDIPRSPQRPKKANGVHVSRCADLASGCAERVLGAAHSAHQLGIAMRHQPIELWRDYSRHVVMVVRCALS
jgi:hypothetical protein